MSKCSVTKSLTESTGESATAFSDLKGTESARKAVIKCVQLGVQDDVMVCCVQQLLTQHNTHSA